MKKFLAFMFIICLIVPALVFVGCKEDPSDPKDPTPPAETITVEGYEVNSIKVFHVLDEYYNLEIGLTNKNTETTEFDFAKIIIKDGNLVVDHNGTAKEYTACQYYKWTFQIDAGHNLSVGKSVGIYYNTTKLATIEVEEF